MDLHSINDFIQLQDVTINHYYISEDNVLLLTLCSINHLQACPSCHSQQLRQVSHLRYFNRETILVPPMKRIFCKHCQWSFTYQYSFVEGKSRYTNDYKRELSMPLVGTTIKQLICAFKVPYSAGECFIKNHLNHFIPHIRSQAMFLAQSTTRLILGIDDFAIRKGHTYNTGFYDLRTGFLLVLVKGRTYQELKDNKELMAQLKLLSAYAVVMDLARSYHKFMGEVFLHAIRVADRFHVNRYVTEALQAVRRRVSLILTPEIRNYFKRHKKLLLIGMNPILIDD